MSNENFFFGVFPEREAALEIENRAKVLRQKHGLLTKLIATDRFHVSLIRFNLHAANQRKLVEAAELAASEVTIRPFNISLEDSGSFRGKETHHPFVLFPDRQSAAALDALRRDLGLSLKKNAPGMKLDFSYSPHLTLTYAEREIDDVYPMKPAIRWKVKEFTLVRSLTGKSTYVPLGRWRLGA